MIVQWFKNFAYNIGLDEIISTEGALRFEVRRLVTYVDHPNPVPSLFPP